MQEQAVQTQTFISSVAWVLPGYAAHIPWEVQMTEDEIQQLRQDPLLAEQLSAQQHEAMSQEEGQDDYPMFGIGTVLEADPNNKYPLAAEELSDDDQDDYIIKDTDALIVAGKVEKEHSSLQIYIYQQDKNNLFVHHELMLSSFPLSIQWLSLKLGSVQNKQKGNYAIVSTFMPEIEVWNLDLVEAVEPDLTLGGQIVNTGRKKPKKFTNNEKKWKEGSHTDSVLSLSLNDTNKNILASASADSTVKIWDINHGKNIYTCTHHTNRVKKVQWNPKDPSVLLTVSEDRKIAILDSRYPDDRIFHNLPKASVEGACWNVNNSSQIAYCTDSGDIYLFDARVPDKHLFKQSAHNKAEVSDIKIGQRNLCYTCSEDQTVKIWNLLDIEKPLAIRKPNCGKMFCIDLYQNQQGPVLAVGNAKGQLFVWDVCENQKVNQHWTK